LPSDSLCWLLSCIFRPLPSIHFGLCQVTAYHRWRFLNLVYFGLCQVFISAFAKWQPFADYCSGAFIAVWVFFLVYFGLCQVFISAFAKWQPLLTTVAGIFRPLSSSSFYLLLLSSFINVLIVEIILLADYKLQFKPVCRKHTGKGHLNFVYAYPHFIKWSSTLALEPSPRRRSKGRRVILGASSWFNHHSSFGIYNHNSYLLDDWDSANRVWAGRHLRFWVC
jgi:hypothetical protein